MFKKNTQSISQINDPVTFRFRAFFEPYACGPTGSQTTQTGLPHVAVPLSDHITLQLFNI